MQAVDLPLLNEEWRPIEGCEDSYEVSSLGRVRSLDRIIERSNGTYQTFKGKVLKPFVSNKGYAMITIRRRNVSVHRLVAKAFVSGKTAQLEVNHKDGVKTNNLFSNLEWCSSSENQKHAIRLGLKIQKGKPWRPLVGFHKERKEESLFLRGAKQGERFGFPHSSLTSCARGRLKSTHGYTWYYYEDIVSGKT